MGAQAPPLRDLIIPRLTGERPAGTPSLTSVFGILGKDVRTTLAPAWVMGPDTNFQAETTPRDPSRLALQHEDAPPPTL